MPRKPSNTREYRRLHADGKSCVEIAEATGVSVSAVAQWLRSHGLDANGSGNVPLSNRPTKPDDEDTRPLPHIPGYSVSQSGRVYSERTDPPREMSRKLSHHGYRVGLSIDGRLQYRYVSSLVLEAWVGPRPEGGVAEFMDGDIANCRAENLRWRQGRTMLDSAEVVRVWQSSSTPAEAAERLGTTQPAVFQTVKRLRQLGIPLKQMSSRLTAEDVQSLKDLAQAELEDFT